MGESINEASSVGYGDFGSGSEGSGDSGSGSEGDEVEFVPSSWDCRAAPSKSSLKSLEQPAVSFIFTYTPFYYAIGF